MHHWSGSAMSKFFTASFHVLIFKSAHPFWCPIIDTVYYYNYTRIFHCIVLQVRKTFGHTHNPLSISFYNWWLASSDVNQVVLGVGLHPCDFYESSGKCTWRGEWHRCNGGLMQLGLWNSCKFLLKDVVLVAFVSLLRLRGVPEPRRAPVWDEDGNGHFHFCGLTFIVDLFCKIWVVKISGLKYMDSRIHKLIIQANSPKDLKHNTS